MQNIVHTINIILRTTSTLLLYSWCAIITCIAKIIFSDAVMLWDTYNMNNQSVIHNICHHHMPPDLPSSDLLCLVTEISKSNDLLFLG